MTKYMNQNNLDVVYSISLQNVAGSPSHFVLLEKPPQPDQSDLLADSCAHFSQEKDDSSNRRTLKSVFEFAKITTPDKKDATSLAKLSPLSQNHLAKIIKVRSLVKFFSLRLTSIKQQFAQMSELTQQLVDQLLNKNLQQLKEIQVKQAYPIFEIKSRLILAWDILQILTILLSFVWVPFEQSFYQIEQRPNKTIEYTFILFYSLDIVVSLNRAKVQMGLIVDNRREILKIYLNECLSRDLVAILCLVARFVVPEMIPSSLLTLLYIIVKVQKVVDIQNHLLEFFAFKGFIADLVTLLQMLILVFMVCHFIACVWHGIAYFSSEQVTWLSYYEFKEQTALMRYLSSFYWAAMTMTTVGYGDITPKNQNEYVYANLTMLIACIFFGSLMSQIGSHLNEIKSRLNEQRKKLSLLNGYMSKHNVDYELQSRIRSHLGYVWEQETDFQVEQIESILQKLSPQLREEITYQVKGRTLQNCYYFKQFSDKLRRGLTQIIEEVHSAPDEIILNNDESIYLISKGKVTHSEPCAEPLQLDVFGEEAFFTNQIDTSSYTSKGFSTLIKIPRLKFLKLLAGFPNDKETYYMSKDMLTMYGKYSRCMICNKYHRRLRCQMLSYIPEKERVIKQELFPVTAMRNQKYRRRYRRCNTSYSGVHPVFDFLQTANQMTPEPSPLDFEEYQSEEQSIKEDNPSVYENKFKTLYLTNGTFAVIDANDAEASIQSPELKRKRKQSRGNLTYLNQIKETKEQASSNTIIKNQSYDEYAKQTSIKSTNMRTQFASLKTKYDFGHSEFEKMQGFTTYFPEGNFDIIIKKFNKKARFSIRKLSHYTFDYLISKKLQKIKRLLKGLEKNASQK